MEPKEVLKLLHMAKEEMRACLPELEKVRNDRAEAERKLKDKQSAWEDEKAVSGKTHNKALIFLTQQTAEFKDEHKRLAEQTTGIKKRLDQQVAEMKKQYQFHMEPPNMREMLVEMFLSHLQNKATLLGMYIASRPAMKEKVDPVWLQNSRYEVTRLVAICFLEIFAVCKEQVRNFDGSVQKVLEKRDLAVNDEQATRRVMADILRTLTPGTRAVKTTTTNKDHLLPHGLPAVAIPPTFSLDKTKLLRNSMEKLDAFGARAMDEATWHSAVADYLDPLMKNCFAFSWDWLLYSYHGEILFEEGPICYKHSICELCEEQKYILPRQDSQCLYLWPALCDSSGTVLVKAIARLINPQK